MKRTMNRLFARLAILCVAVILGAIAVTQAQRGLQNSTEVAGTETPPAIGTTQPIPPADLVPLSGHDIGVQNPPETYGGSQGFGGYNDVPATAPPQTDPYAQETPALPPATYQPEETYQPEPTYQPEAVYQPEPPAATNAYIDDPEEDYGSLYEQPVISPPAPPVAEVQYLHETPDLPPIVAEAQPEPALSNLDQFAADPSAGASATELPPINMLPSTPATDVVPVPEPVAEYGGYGSDPVTVQRTPEPIAANSLRQAGAASIAQVPQNNLAQNPITPIAGFESTPSAADNYGGNLGAATYNVGSERTANSRNQFSQQPAFDTVNRGMGGSMGNGKPGPSALEGPQSPTLVVTKNAPPEVQVGKVAKFEVTVRNVGAVDAKDVVIRDEVPQGAQLVETIPAAGKTANGALMWEMGTIKAGAEATVVMQIMPTAEGDIGSVATVSFQAAASAKSIATRPQLTLEHTGPGKVLIGNDVIFNIKLSNPGSGTANNVVISEDIPAGLSHVDGRQMEYQVGTMRPGETRLIELTLKADEAGMVDNLLIAKADSGLRVEDHCPVEVIAPNLRVAIEGPRRRYLERRATFDLKVANPGTAAARDVELIAHMPRGLKFVSTNNAGQYNSQNHTVRWNLAELPPQEMGVVQLTAIPEEVGNHKIRVETQAQMGLSDAADHDLSVEGLAAILFTVTDAIDPIEVGEQTTYEIRIVNQGSKIGTNVRLAALIPQGMTAVNGEGPTRAAINGQQIVFDALGRLAPQADAFYKIHVKGNTPGDKRIQVQLISDDVQQPVTKEESTHVYADE